MTRPTDMLRAGCDILDDFLVPNGFHFELRDEGPSSGGQFAWGRYDNAEREGDVRVIDESGVDYLFSADRFVVIDPPAVVGESVLRSS